MPPTSIQENRADFSRTYEPIDAARYQTQQSQQYYERMRARVNEESKSLLSGGQGIYTGGAGSSAYKAMTAGRHEPSEREYRTQSRRNRAYARDAVERTMQAPMNFYDSFKHFGAEFGIGESVEPAVYNALRTGGAGAAGGAGGMGFAGATATSMAVGTGVGLAALGAAEGTIQYTGVRQGFNQFEEIRNLRGASRPMTSGVASGPNGRMSRDMAQNIVTDMSEQARMNTVKRDGDSLEEMKEQAGILAEYQLLEGVQSADEFERKFKRLKNGVRRVMEVMGTTFEEGTKLMKDFRNAGVSPMQGVEMINKGRMTSAQFGNNFQEGHASGMQTAMAMRQSGFSMGAGYQMGQYASGMAQNIYEGNYLDDKTMYNVGGQRGVQQEIQRGNMQFMESSGFTAMLMGAQNQDGSFSTQNVLDTLAGRRGSAANAAAAGRSMDSMKDVLNYRANGRDFMSEMMETNPSLLAGLKVRHTMDLARRTGNDPENMSESQLAEFAGIATNMTPDQFRVAAAEVRSASETKGRRAQEKRRVGEARAEDMYRTGLYEQAGEALRENETFGDLVEFSADTVGDVRDSIYNAQKSITGTLTREFSGDRMITSDATATKFFSRADDVSGDGRGTMYYDPNDLFSTSDSADIVEQQVDSMNLDSAVKISGERRRKVYGETRFRFTDEEIEQLDGLSKSDGTEIEIHGQKMTEFSERALKRAGISGVEGDPDSRDGGELLGDVAATSAAAGAGGFAAGGFVGSAVAGTGGALYEASGLVTGDSEYTFYQESEKQRIEDFRENVAKQITKSRQVAPEETLESETAKRQFEKLRGSNISDDKIQYLQQESGEDGNLPLREFMMKRFKEAFEIDAKRNSEKFREQVISELGRKENQKAVGRFMNMLEKRGVEDPARHLSTALETGMSVEDMQDAMKGGRKAVRGAISDYDNLGDEEMSEEMVGYLVMKDYAQKVGRDNLTQQQKDKLDAKRYSVMEGVSQKEERNLLKGFRENVKEDDDLTMRVIRLGYSGIGDSGRNVSGEGSQTSSGGSASQETQNPDEELRREMHQKVLKIAELLKGMEQSVSDTASNQEDLVGEIQTLKNQHP
jgi:hypothetical protein